MTENINENSEFFSQNQIAEDRPIQDKDRPIQEKNGRTQDKNSRTQVKDRPIQDKNSPIPNRLAQITQEFVTKSKEILQDNLTGIYLHGSAVMGCYNPAKSDIDLIVVVNDNVADAIKRRFMDMVTELNSRTSGKGIEMSIVKKEVCKPFQYPTPFELHFSQMHINWYKDKPEDYIQKMNGTDKDLAAHFTIITRRGRCLFGLPIEEVFGEVPAKDYMDSIHDDIAEAPEDIEENTMYLTLNLARVLAYKEEGLVLSKKEGGEWALKNLPDKYHPLVLESLVEYLEGKDVQYNVELAKDYANYLLGKCSESKLKHTN